MDESKDPSPDPIPSDADAASPRLDVWFHLGPWVHRKKIVLSHSPEGTGVSAQIIWGLMYGFLHERWNIQVERGEIIRIIPLGKPFSPTPSDNDLGVPSFIHLKLVNGCTLDWDDSPEAIKLGRLIHDLVLQDPRDADLTTTVAAIRRMTSVSVVDLQTTPRTTADLSPVIRAIAGVHSKRDRTAHTLTLDLDPASFPKDHDALARLIAVFPYIKASLCTVKAATRFPGFSPALVKCLHPQRAYNALDRDDVTDAQCEAVFDTLDGKHVFFPAFASAQGLETVLNYLERRDGLIPHIYVTGLGQDLVSRWRPNITTTLAVDRLDTLVAAAHLFAKDPTLQTIDLMHGGRISNFDAKHLFFDPLTRMGRRPETVHVIHAPCEFYFAQALVVLPEEPGVLDKTVALCIDRANRLIRANTPVEHGDRRLPLVLTLLSGLVDAPQCDALKDLAKRLDPLVPPDPDEDGRGQHACSVYDPLTRRISTLSTRHWRNVAECFPVASDHDPRRIIRQEGESL